jgi:GntR family transcriptional regulator
MSQTSFEFKADANDSSPLYMQIARKLSDDVHNGRYQVDQALPSERVLSELLNVSRVTARKAIDQLVDQGLVVRRRGSGNYIAPRIEQPLSNLTSFSEQLQQRGHIPGSRWLKRAIVTPTPEEQLSLGLSPYSKVARLERLRLADDVVMAYEVSVLPQTVLNDPNAVGNSLYQYLDSIGQSPARALQHIRAMNASAELAKQLGVPEGQAVLYITRIAYLESGEAMELTHSYCHSDHYDFVAEMRRATSSTAGRSNGDWRRTLAICVRAWRMSSWSAMPPMQTRIACGGGPSTAKASLGTTPMPVARRCAVNASRSHCSGNFIHRWNASGAEA